MHAIVSYDDTLNDQDALILARQLGDAGAELTLAYVRHAVLASPDAEELNHHEAHALLARGARWLDDIEVERRVVIDPATGEGLGRLAQSQGADLLIFGSDYRTAAGHVAPGRSAQGLLDGGQTALAFAPAGYRANRGAIRSIGVLPAGDQAVLDTAESLSVALGAELLGATRGVDLLVVGSRPEATPGRVLASAHALTAIENADCPVIVLARATPLELAVSLV